MKEEEYLIDLGEGQTSISTTKLKGELDALIIESVEQVEIIIESELGYLIFHRPQHRGIVYYSLRNRVTTPILNLLDHLDFDKFNLNEELYITVRGRKDEKVKIIIRLD